MTIAPLPSPYNGNTHVRLVRVDFETEPAVAHFRQGRFSDGVTPPSMPYNDAAAPLGWVETPELNTAKLNAGVSSLYDVIVAIHNDLQAHA